MPPSHSHMTVCSVPPFSLFQILYIFQPQPAFLSLIIISLSLNRTRPKFWPSLQNFPLARSK